MKVVMHVVMSSRKRLLWCALQCRNSRTPRWTAAFALCSEDVEHYQFTSGTHTYIYIYIHTYIHTHTHNSRAHTQTHARTHIHSRAHAHTHTRARARTHTQRHTERAIHRGSNDSPRSQDDSYCSASSTQPTCFRTFKCLSLNGWRSNGAGVVPH